MTFKIIRDSSTKTITMVSIEALMSYAHYVSQIVHLRQYIESDNALQKTAMVCINREKSPAQSSGQCRLHAIETQFVY